MGCLDEGNGDIENGVNIGCGEVGFEEEAKPDIAAIEEAVKVLLLGLGEDINREGLRKTPLRVAKAFREGTRGSGIFDDRKADVWSDFFCLLKFRGIEIEKVHLRGSSDQWWCPSLSALSAKVSSKTVPVNPAMVTAVSSILKSLGEDSLRKELTGTPGRFVKWMMNFQSIDMDVKLNGSLSGDTFDPDREVNFKDRQIHCELNLPFWSQCEHHILPFHGVVHIGYFISEGFDPIAKSLVQSIVHFYGFKLQVQERLTRQIAETIAPLLLGGHVIVVVEASHTCMISRGIEKFGSSTATIAVLGHFSTDLAAKAMFFQSVASATTSRVQ